MLESDAINHICPFKLARANILPEEIHCHGTACMAWLNYFTTDDEPEQVKEQGPSDNVVNIHDHKPEDTEEPVAVLMEPRQGHCTLTWGGG